MKKYAIGIDLGGTHLRIGLVSKSGKVLDFQKMRTPKTVKDIINQMKKIAGELVTRNSLILKDNILGIGVAIASPVNPKTGLVNWKKTFPFSRSFSIREVLKREFQKPVFIDNDLKASALAEQNYGILKNKKNGVILTVSTGIGAGVIINGEIYNGQNFSAGEFSQMIINPFEKSLKCNRGDSGCFESLASAKSAEKRYFLKCKKHLVAEEIVALAKKGDKKSLKILGEIGFWLGVGITNVINILDPEIIVIYGSFFLNIWPLVNRDIKKITKERSLNPKIIFKKTKLGDNGGVIGAATLVFK